MSEPVTIADVANWHLRQTAHLDGPRGKNGWFGDIHQCIEQPRLSRIVKYFRKDRSHTVTWRIDRHDAADLQEAVATLNTPPVLTDAEKEALAKYPTEWTHAHEAMRMVGGYELHHALGDKGMIENDGDHSWRRIAVVTRDRNGENGCGNG